MNIWNKRNVYVTAAIHKKIEKLEEFFFFPAAIKLFYLCMHLMVLRI